MNDTRKSFILVAEDDSALRYLAERQLVKLGVDCDLAIDGREAVEMAKNRKYDLIIMDVQMPVMDGLEASREIRLYERITNQGQTPIMAMSANPQREKCYDAGMNDFIFKPILLDELKKSLDKWLKSPV